MPIRMTRPVAYCMKLDRYTLPSRSGKVSAPSRFPIRLVGFPKTMKAMSTPTRMFSRTSHMMPSPSLAAQPPKPTMAEVLMKVAPYESPMITGCTFPPASM